MDWHEIADQAGHAAAVLTAVGLFAALIWGAVRARADWTHANVEESSAELDAAAHEADEARAREEAQRIATTELLNIKDEMIEALKEDREELRTQLRRALDREAKQTERLDRLDSQLRDVQKENSDSTMRLLEAFAGSDRCDRALTGCRDRIIPGNRRDMAAVSTGGTD